jgi:hypothetical protein
MSIKLEKRIAALERQVAKLQQQQLSKPSAGRAWLDDLYGKFAGDPVFANAMKLGREYRKSLGRPGKRRQCIHSRIS